MANSKDSNDNMARRRSSLAPMPMNIIFARSNAPTIPGPIATAAAQDQHRRLSISTLGLPSNSPSKASSFPFGGRRSSVASSIGSANLEENAIDEDDINRSIPTTPLGRRMSLGGQAIRSASGRNGSGSFGEAGSFSFSDHFRIRAESSLSQIQRQSFPASPNPTRNAAISNTLVEMPPPTTVPPPALIRSQYKEPDAFQERILKGDFYMD